MTNLEDINFLDPTEDDLAKAAELDALYEIWDRERRLGMLDKPEKPAPKPEPDPAPVETAEDWQVALEKVKYSKRLAESRHGRGSATFKKLEVTEQQVLQGLTDAQRRDNDALLHAAALDDSRRRAKAQIEGEVAEEKRAAGELEARMAEVDPTYAPGFAAKNRARWTDEAVQARIDQAANARMKMLDATSELATSMADFPPEVRDQAVRQMRDQIERGSDAFLPTISTSDQGHVRFALGDQPGAQMAAEALDARYGPSWRSSTYARSVIERRRMRGE